MMVRDSIKKIFSSSSRNLDDDNNMSDDQSDNDDDNKGISIYPVFDLFKKTFI